MYIEEAIEKFKKLPEEVLLEVDNEKVSSTLNNVGNKYGVNITPLLVFYVIGEVTDDSLEEYIKDNYELDTVQVSKIIHDFQRNVIKPLQLRLSFLNANPNKSFGIDDEKEVLEDMFRDNVVKEINNSLVIKKAINHRIINILRKDIDFIDKLVKRLLENEEKISYKTFILNKVKVRPTISNWIKDLISLEGSGFIDNVIFFDYVVNSNNMKMLSDKERDLVKRVLRLYINLAFFPESMPDDNIENWEIIPIDKNRLKVDAPRKKIGVPKSEDEKKIEEAEAMMKQQGGGGLEGLVLEEEVERRKRIEELRFAISKYPAGSLERRVLEEEIGKLEQ